MLIKKLKALLIFLIYLDLLESISSYFFWCKTVGLSHYVSQHWALKFNSHNLFCNGAPLSVFLNISIKLGLQQVSIFSVHELESNLEPLHVIFMNSKPLGSVKKCSLQMLVFKIDTKAVSTLLGKRELGKWLLIPLHSNSKFSVSQINGYICG